MTLEDFVNCKHNMVEFGEPGYRCIECRATLQEIVLLGIFERLDYMHGHTHAISRSLAELTETIEAHE